MNAGIYKLIFSKRLNALVVVGEICSSQGKAPGTTRALKRSAKGMVQVVRILGMLSSGALLVSTAWATPAPGELPTGGQVVQGSASISQSGAQMDINQASQRTVINWQSFSVGVDAKVNFIQPNSNAVALNRVVTNKPSEIFGKITANGQVILVNNNGIVFGKDGSASASSFTATTLDISDKDFMEGKNRFSSNGAQGEVVNHGTIETKNGGYVALLGAKVTNDGKIITHNGTVALGAADSISIPMTSSGKIKMQLSAGSINAAVENTKNGVIVTEGGDVYLQAAAANNAMASIKHSGQIDTSGEQAGKAILLADSGEITVDGNITANSSNAANKGGDIIIGRDTDTGVLAKTTDVSGASLESKKGFVETSAHQLKVDGIKVKAKEWLLDPDDIEITNGPLTAGYTTQVSTSTITNALNTGTSITLDTATGSTGVNGNILVTSAINATNTTNTNATLTLKANNGIKTNADIIGTTQVGSTGKINVNMTALGAAGNADSGIKITKNIDVTGSLSITGTNNFATGAGVSIAPSTGLGGGTQTLKAGDDLTITGTSNIANAAGYGVCISSCGPAAYAAITNITSSTGNVSITGNTQTSRGVSFGGGTGIGTHTYNISAAKNVEIKGATQGKQAATAYGVFENVSAQLNLASSTGSILIDGDASADTLSTSGQGVGLQGNLSFAAANGSTISGKGRTTSPLATKHGAVYIASSASTPQLINVTSGDLLISGSGGAYGVAIGAATTNTTINNSLGNIKIEGTGSSDFGVSFTKTTINGKNLNAIGVATTTGRGVQFLGTNTLNAITDIKGTANSGIGIYEGGPLNIAGSNVTAGSATIFTGTSTSGKGFYANSAITATTAAVSIKGESLGGEVGVHFDGGSSIQADSYTVKGASNTNSGVYFFGGTSTFKSTSTTVDSLIEGTSKTAGNAIFAYSSAIINLDSGSGKATMATDANSSGGIRLGYAGGAVVNTKGDITIGSHSNANAFLMNQGTINALSGNLTLKGKSTGNGIFFQDGGGYGAQLIGTNGAKITLDGISTSAGDGIRLALFDWAPNRPYLISSSGAGGSVTLNGASSQGNGVLTGRAQIISNDGNSINITGKGADSGTGAGVGVYAGEAITANGGGKITINGSTNGGNVGALLGDKSKVQSMAGEVAINGYSKGGIGAQLQGIVYADKDIVVNGNSDSTTLLSGGLPAKDANGNYIQPGYAGVLMQNSVESNNGNITVTGTTKSLVTQAVQMAKLPTTASSGALKTNASNKIININADSLDIGATSTVNAGNTGTVNIKTTSLTRGIRMGGSDTNARLGIDNGELSRITAGNLVIGDTNSTGLISFESAVATIAQTGNITLKTGGNIQFGYASGYGSLTVDPTKTLTLNAAGSNSTIKELWINPANFVKASNLEILGSNAEVTLTNKFNEIGNLAANVKSINFTNKGALIVGTVNNANGINATNGVNVTTQTGDLNLNESISNTAGNVVLGAGVSKLAGESTGGDVKTVMGKGVTHTSGNLYVYSGSASNTGLLSNLDTALGALTVDGTANQNADTNVAYNANSLGISGSTAVAQVMFREKVTITNGLVGTNLDKTYGDANTLNSATAALLVDTQTKLKQELGNSGNYETNSGGINNIRIAKSVIIDSLTGNLSNTVYSTSDHLNASSYTYGPLTSNKYTISGITGNVGVNVNKLALTGASIANAGNVYGGPVAAGAVNLSGTNIVTGDNVTAGTASVVSTNGDLSTSGNLKAGSYTQQMTGLSGNDAGNYDFSGVTSANNYTVSKLALTGASIANAGNVYGDSVAAGAVNLSGANIVTGDNVGVGSASVVSTISDLSTSGNLKHGAYNQQMTSLSGTDAGNYDFSGVSSAGSYAIAKKDAAILTDGNTVAFNGAQQTDTVTKKGFIDGDKVGSVSGAGTGIQVGSYAPHLQLAGDMADINNYNVTYGNAKFVIADTDPLLNPVPVNPDYKTPDNMGKANELVTTQQNNEQIQKQCSLEFAKECKVQPTTVQEIAPRYVTFY